MSATPTLYTNENIQGGPKKKTIPKLTKMIDTKICGPDINA